MAMYRYGHASVAKPSISPDDWTDHIYKGACSGDKCRMKTAKSIIAKYSPDKYILSHCTIIAAVDTELADSKDAKSDYYIRPEFSKFVNNNGDAWSKQMLMACYKTFIGGENYCFSEGTRVLMADGIYKPIELIKEGDRVINRKGEIGIVSKTDRKSVV